MRWEGGGERGRIILKLVSACKKLTERSRSRVIIVGKTTTDVILSPIRQQFYKKKLPLLKVFWYIYIAITHRGCKLLIEFLSARKKDAAVALLFTGHELAPALNIDGMIIF